MKTNERQEWLRTARHRLKCANDGTSNMRKGKNQRSSMASNFLDRAPNLHIEEDIQHFIKAAEAFLIASKWRDAALAYALAASMYHLELDALNEAALLYTEAGLVADKFDSGEEYFKKAVSIYCDCKKYRQAARIRKWIAEAKEKNNNYEEAIAQFKMTTQYYRAAKMDLQVLECQRKVGYLLARSGKYDQASEAEQEIARGEELRHNLSKYSAQHSFFRAILLLMARDNCDLDQVKTVLQESMQLDFRFETSVGCAFLNNILHVLVELENDAGTVHHEFADHIFDYNELYPFDEIDLELLERIYSLHFDSEMDE